MVATNFSTLTDGFQFLSLFDQAFALVPPYGTILVPTSGGTYTIPATDFRDVLINGSAANSVQLPDSTLRNGISQAVVDITGNAATFNITILPFGSQKIRGQNNLKIVANYGGFTLWPISTGGWYLR
mgnify:CR=1 FL=1